jgi:hypothetical protein
MANAFRSQSRSVQRFTGLPGAEKVRLWPMIAEILDRERATYQDIGDQVVLGALNSVLTAGIMAGRYREVHAALEQLLGLSVPAGKSVSDEPLPVPAGKVIPSREVEAANGRKPPAKATGR